MERLLSELEIHPQRRRRAIVVAASFGLLLTGAGVNAMLLSPSDAAAAPRCDNGRFRFSGVWDEPRKLQMRDAFSRHGARGAIAWRGFASIVDRRAQAWAAMYEEACTATHIHGNQSAAVLDLRMECLDRKLQEINNLVEVYAEELDPKVLDRAIGAADNLTLVSACADVTNLRAIVPLPEDPTSRAKVASLRQRVGRARALYEAGRFEKEREQLSSFKREADQLGYAPLAAEVTHALGNALSVLGKAEEAEGLLLEAAEQAVRARDWRLEAETWVTLVSNYGRLGRVQDGLMAARVARLAVERAHGDDVLRARLANNTGFAEYNAGRYEDAVRHFQRAQELWKASLGPGSRRYATSLGNTGSTLVELGRIREGLEHLERSLAARRAILRPDHADLTYSLQPLGNAYRDLGMFGKAYESCRAAFEIRRKEFGPEHPETTFALNALAEAEANLGNTHRALELFEETLAIQKRVLDPQDVSLGTTYLDMGTAQRRASLEDQAERSFQRVLDHNARTANPEHANTGYALVGLGLLHNRQRLYRRGLQECQRALKILTRELGEKSSKLSQTRECIGESLIGLGDHQAARGELERALNATDERETSPQRIAALRFQLARALWSSSVDRPRAHELALSALTALRTAEGDPRSLEPIEAWLVGKTR